MWVCLQLMQVCVCAYGRVCVSTLNNPKMAGADGYVYRLNEQTCSVLSTPKFLYVFYSFSDIHIERYIQL